MARNPTGRFSDRVENYVKYRPSYPGAIFEILEQETSLTSRAVIADIGSGTGISSALFLQRQNLVYAVEPNPEMRAAAEARLFHFPHFRSVAGTAEQTTLGDRTVDYIVVAQAFHWFNPVQTKREFARILRPRGWVVLLWNTRQLDTTPFLIAYENLLQRYGTDYREIHHRNTDQATLAEFLGSALRVYQRPNRQYFDFEGLKGRLLSSSYTPNEGHPDYEAMLTELRQIFDQYQSDDRVSFDYDTDIYLAQWS